LWDNSCRKEGQTRKGRQGVLCIPLIAYNSLPSVTVWSGSIDITVVLSFDCPLMGMFDGMQHEMSELEGQIVLHLF
jgi:hypothetical protein